MKSEPTVSYNIEPGKKPQLHAEITRHDRMHGKCTSHKVISFSSMPVLANFLQRSKQADRVKNLDVLPQGLMAVANNY